MHHDRIDTDQLEQHHVFRKGFLQRGIGHGVAAIFDDHGLAMELADIGQGPRQNLGLIKRGDGRGGGGRSVGHARHPLGETLEKLQRRIVPHCSRSTPRNTMREPSMQPGSQQQKAYEALLVVVPS